MKILKTSLIGAALVSGLAFGADADLPTAESIFDRYVEVTGGKAAYEKRKTEYGKGKVRIPAANIEGTVEAWSASPNLALLVIELPGVGKIESGTNGEDAWELSAVMGPRLKSGEEKSDALREMMFNMPIHWRKLYTKVETVGTEKLDGVECYKVVATTPSNRTETFLFDAKTGLNLSVQRTAVTAMGDVKAEVLMKDYANHGGVLSPNTLIQRAAGQEMVIQFETVQPNAVIPAGKFDPPAEIRQLIKPKDKPAKKAA